VSENMTRLDKVTPFPPVGTRCFYKNDAIKLSGWGFLAEPLDDSDNSELPLWVPWRGTLHGPVNEGQVGLNVLAPGCGMLPGDDVYRVLPAILLWVEENP
jgi:hypothetical protein